MLCNTLRYLMHGTPRVSQRCWVNYLPFVWLTGRPFFYFILSFDKSPNTQLGAMPDWCHHLTFIINTTTPKLHYNNADPWTKYHICAQTKLNANDNNLSDIFIKLQRNMWFEWVGTGQVRPGGWKETLHCDWLSDCYSSCHLWEKHFLLYLSHNQWKITVYKELQL